MNISMTRSYGRAPTSERVYGSVAEELGRQHHAERGVSRDGIILPLRLISAMNSEIFDAYGEPFVVPEPRAVDVVVMDNLSAHKRASIGQLIAAAGAELVYLPPYSPDLNPIEMMVEGEIGAARDRRPHLRGPRASDRHRARRDHLIRRGNYISHAGYSLH